MVAAMENATTTGATDGWDALLKAAGSPFGAGEIEALVAGVCAAPEGVEPDGWMRLVAPEPTPELAAALGAIKARIAAASDDGLNGDADHSGRLAALRAELAKRELAGFVVQVGDEHHGEYVARRNERLAWISGFTGSAGFAAILAQEAAIFVDGRYTLQAGQQVNTKAFSRHHLIEEPAADWLAGHLAEGARLGFDPWLHTPREAARLEAACTRAGAALVALDNNPIDAIWDGQPPHPIGAVAAHDIAFAGRPSAEKRAALGAALTKQASDAMVLSAPDSIAWLLNIRGADVPCTPLPLCFALLHASGEVDLFIDPRKLLPGTAEALGGEVTRHRPDALGAALDALGEAAKRVGHDPASVPSWIATRLSSAGATLVESDDPCQAPKARKNTAELAGTKAAHERDGAALTRFLCWLDGAVRKGGVSELDAIDRLAGFREGGEHYRGPSFETISGAGEHGAIVHYRATPESDKPIGSDEVYLVDSGGQYLDGTTDVTRTVGFTTITPEQRIRFTLVLKGHIALATARFPKGTTGSQLDPLARQFLWRAGLDFDHGTGHGVGSYLGVHEGPQRISKMASTVALEPDMIVSNEPGYYKTGAYGIRIENLVTVIEAEAPNGADKPLLGFETLTLAPIDRKLIEPALLNPAERAWLDAYHIRVRETLQRRLDKATRRWLESVTQPIA